MKIFIYTDYKSKENNFEISRLRKNFKGFLEMENESYITQNQTNFYNIAQYFSLNDVSVFSLNKKGGIKNIICCLYTELEYENSLISLNINKNGEYGISKTLINKINLYDYCFVPCNCAKYLLIKEGVTIPIYVVNPGVRLTKFEIENTTICPLFSEIYGISEENIATTLLREDDIECIKNIEKVAISLPNLKMVVICRCSNERIFKKLKKRFSKLKNIYFFSFLDEDVYISLMHMSKLFLCLNSYPTNVIESLEAMASKNTIFSLSNSIYKDIVIDKENGYIYNDLNKLIEGINLFLSGEIAPLDKEGYEFATQYSLNRYGKNLVDIYKEIDEVNKYDWS